MLCLSLKCCIRINAVVSIPDDLHSSDYSLINSQMLQNNAHVSTVSEKGCKSLGTHLLSSEVVSITLSNNKTKGGDGGVDDEVEEEVALWPFSFSVSNY